MKTTDYTDFTDWIEPGSLKKTTQTTLLPASAQLETGFHSQGRRIKKDWIHRKAAEAKGRSENDHQKTQVRQYGLLPASGSLGLCF
jgi:hypothetical protein